MRFDRVDEGLKRIYYKYGNRSICFQEDAPDDFVAYRCSRDGEPDSPYVNTFNLINNVPKPPVESDMVTRFWHMVLLFRDE